MAGFTTNFLNLCKLSVNETSLMGVTSQQVRTKYADWKMIRDVNRRKLVKQHAPEKLRLLALKRNTVLPSIIREDAGRGLDSLPRYCHIKYIWGRCAVTSRPRGNVLEYRLSRIVWRHLADYNKLSGVQRAMW